MFAVLGWLVKEAKQPWPSRGLQHGKQAELIFRPMRDWFLRPMEEKPIQSEGTEMHPISLQRPIPGSAMLRKLLGQEAPRENKPAA
jgi:hypothetical protein